MKITISPTGTITSRYGEVDSVHPYGHKGLDFACRTGEEIHSIVDGIVSKIVHTSQGVGLGNGLFIKTESGYQFIFGHMSKIKGFQIGDKVGKGEVIGYCGSSGRSFGSHLHLASLDPSGNYINPEVTFNLLKKSYKLVKHTFDSFDIPTIF